jgi:hypothetical protein
MSNQINNNNPKQAALSSGILRKRTMNNLQKLGGIAALYEAIAYVVGIVFYIFIMDYSAVVDPVQKVALLADNQVSMVIITLIIYVIFGVFLAVLVLALNDRLKVSTPTLAQLATTFGLFWAGVVIASGMIFNIGLGTVIDLYATNPAQAATAWLTIEAVSEGLGGGTEILGGLWILLVSWAALQAGAFSRGLNTLGLVIGVAGIVSVVPALSEIGGAIFGLTQIVWFVWIGIIMFRSSPTPVVEQPKTFATTG